MNKMILLLAALLLSLPAFAKDYEIFDGRMYNGNYYPLIDNIEWGEGDNEGPHMEFHIHQKDKRVEVAVVPGLKAGKPVFWIMYDLAYRGERVCRRVLAPFQFKEGQKVHAYRDDSDPDYDNVYFYSVPWKQKGKKIVPEYAMPAYSRCTDENADNMPEPKGSKAPAAPGAPSPSPAQAVKGPSPASIPAAPKPELDNTAVPFNF